MEYLALVATVRAVLAAVSVWQKERDYTRTAQEYNRTQAQTLDDPEAQAAAEELEGVLPPEVAETFYANIEACWENFNACIRGKSDEQDFLECESANQRCICSNLRALLRSNGCLPPEFENLWTQFGCGPAPELC